MTGRRVDADLLVAGAGPVGLATAVMAAQAGWRVVVADPRETPTDKACGEGLMPSAVTALRRIGVRPPGWPFAGIRYVAAAGEPVAEARFRAGPGLGVRRTALSAALGRRAADLGVVRLAARVGAVRQDAAGVCAAGVRARWLVAADGLHSPLRRSLGLDLPPRGTPRWGLRRHFAVAPWTDVVEVHWSEAAEAYVTPVGPDTVGVALLTARRGAGFDELLGGFAALARRLDGAPPTSPLRGAGPLRQRARARSCGRVLLAGDAAGYVDALTGEGVAVGLAAARAAVGCLLAGRPGDYDAAWRRASRRYRTLTTAVLAASQRPALRAALVPAAARVPAVFGRVVDALA